MATCIKKKHNDASSDVPLISLDDISPFVTYYYKDRKRDSYVENII